jgi:hypothetical protein
MTRAGAVSATLNRWNDYLAAYFVNSVLCEETMLESWVRYAVYFFDYRIGGLSEAFRVIPSNISRLVPLQYPPPWDDSYRERLTFPRKEPIYESSSSPHSTRSIHYTPGLSGLTIEGLKSLGESESIGRPRSPDSEVGKSKAVNVNAESSRKEMKRSQSL